MSSKAWERFLSAMYLEETDQVPVALFGTTRFFAYHSGLKIFDRIHDPCKMFVKGTSRDVEDACRKCISAWAMVSREC